MVTEKLSIGIIGGSGHEGSGLALRWAAAGHDVIIGSRSVEKAQEAAQKLNALLAGRGQLRGGSNADAAAQTIVVLSVPFAAQRVTSFHERQRTKTWMYQDNTATLGQVVTPVDAVGVYVPGGKAVYPSSVLMCAIPAKVAGVERIVMVTPPQKGAINPYLLVAADIAGVTEIYRVGGVQAVGALAYGTKTIAKVDKVVGPGNIYVATAKRLLYEIGRAHV